jgi:hypothetical protein
MSLAEATTNVVVGFILAVVTQLTIFPLLGIHIQMEKNLLLACIFTAVSLVRSFALRRLFEAMRLHHDRTRRRPS